jgi:L-fuculose-phosphate aldolase
MAPPGTGADGDASGERRGDVRSRVAWACRILASEGYQDLTLGHVSARDRERQDRMWIKRRGVTLGEVTSADVIEFEIGADLRDASDDMHLEAVLHTEVYRRLAVYDGSPDLITEPEQGSEVAEALGKHSVVLLRNHGVLVVQRDLAWMVLAAVTLERALMVQSIAATLGKARPIEPMLIGELNRHKYNDALVAEYWDAWLREMRRRGLDDGIDG